LEVLAPALDRGRDLATPVAELRSFLAELVVDEDVGACLLCLLLHKV
jgi:hypothetical protein